MSDVKAYLDRGIERLQITRYNINPFTNGEIVKDNGEYIWQDEYSEARSPNIAVKLGADEEVKDLLDST